MRFLIIIKYQFEGYHKWENCPFDDVSFLRQTHRHLFHVKVEKEVFHEDREIEIIRLKRELEAYSKTKLDYGNWSCEMIAKDLVAKFNLVSCEVLEDNENGAKVVR